ncbi:MAG: FAD-dependent oxidoreductase, partial [Verrucomicrobiales bacterium]
ADERGLSPADLPGIVVDDESAKFEGNWEESGAAKSYVGFGYRHEGNTAKGAASVTFATTIEKAGTYAVRLAYPPNNNRASRVKVGISHRGGEAEVIIDQRKAPSHDLFQDLGIFEFEAGVNATVTLNNADTEGYVVVDAVQWVPAE